MSLPPCYPMLDSEMPVFEPHAAGLGTDSQRWPGKRRRRAHHKVKTGCKACKTRRQKCDELKPACSGCQRHSTNCQYPPQDTTIAQRRVPDAFVATQSIPASPPSELNLSDLELLTQYLTSTCIATSQSPEVTAYIQRATPQLGQEYPFVMRGIFAQAATHLSRLRPAQETHYSSLAAKHISVAIPEFRATLENLNNQNHRAVMTYSKMLLWCSFASPDPKLDANTSLDGQDSGSWLPRWFCLLHGSCLVVESCRGWLKDPPHLLADLDNVNGTLDEFDDRQLATLFNALPLAGAHSSLFHTVATSLVTAFVRATKRPQNTPLRNAMNYWVGRLPEEYTRLLQDKEPWTLVVLAYFCVLVRRSETVWFMSGKARILLLSIMRRLDPISRDFIKWPIQQLGIAMEGRSV